ncbi:MAG: lipocalin family protein [Thioalkalispiraceae bacterium]
MNKINFAFVSAFFLASCSTHPPIRTEKSVDISKFMGDWYVIANIPTFIEKGAHNAIESYKLNEDGTISTTFTFRQDSFDGEIKTYNPTGYIYDKDSNAVWGMQFIWPFKSDYRIVYLDDNYTQVIIGRLKRDYVWIMARSPEIPESEYTKLVSIIKQEGYDVSKLQRVPQNWKSGTGK